MKEYKTLEALHLTVGTIKNCNTDLLNEYHFELAINENQSVHFSCTPQCFTELVTGYLISSGIIKTVEEIELLTMDVAGSDARVRCRNAEEKKIPCLKKNALKLDFKMIVQSANEFYAPENSHPVRGAHYAALICPDGRSYMAMDIGRHNAIDKAVGLAVNEKAILSESMLLSTGRAPVDIVKKAIFAEIPVLICRSVPTYQAVELARQCNLTLIGRVEGHYQNIVVYSGEQRIR